MGGGGFMVMEALGDIKNHFHVFKFDNKAERGLRSSQRRKPHKGSDNTQFCAERESYVTALRLDTFKQLRKLKAGKKERRIFDKKKA